MAGVLGITAESLTVVVATHELAHAYSHLGRDIDGKKWETEAFARADLNIVEGIAQFYTEVGGRKMETRNPAVLPAYEKLTEIQQGPYRVHEEWAKRSTQRAAWTRELDLIPLDGIEDNRQGKDLAHERVKALHPLPQGKHRYPKDFGKWLTKAFEEPSEDGIAPWLSLEFWQHEVDKVLIQGIFARDVTQDEVVQRVRSVWPKLSTSWLGARMEEVARTGLPRWMDQAFWATRDRPDSAILLSGLRNASQCQSEAVETVLHAFPQLHVGMIWDRLRRLRKQRTADLQEVVPAFVVANDCNNRVEAGGGQADSTATAQLDEMVAPSGIDRRFCTQRVDPDLARGNSNREPIRARNS